MVTQNLNRHEVRVQSKPVFVKKLKFKKKKSVLRHVRMTFKNSSYQEKMKKIRLDKSLD